MNMGEPVVGWADPVALKKASMGEARTAVAAFVGAIAVVYQVRHDDLPFVQDLRVFEYALAGLLVLLSGCVGWLAWFYRRVVSEGAGALQARLEGDDGVVLGTPFSMAVGRGKRFASHETLALSVTTRTIKRRILSKWTIAGSRGSVVATSLGVWTEEQWYELAAGLQRLGFTVVAEPEAAVSHAPATDG